jgi:hypothetical protein
MARSAASCKSSRPGAGLTGRAALCPAGSEQSAASLSQARRTRQSGQAVPMDGGAGEAAAAHAPPRGHAGAFGGCPFAGSCFVAVDEHSASGEATPCQCGLGRRSRGPWSVFAGGFRTLPSASEILPIGTWQRRPELRGGLPSFARMGPRERPGAGPPPPGLLEGGGGRRALPGVLARGGGRAQPTGPCTPAKTQKGHLCSQHLNRCARGGGVPLSAGGT